MKTIKNKTFIRAPKFVWALILLLLLSSLMVTTVWAIKPDKPEKPPGKPSDPELVTADYSIEIGESGENIILDSPDNLLVLGVEGGYWLPPPTKGKSQKERTWRIGLISVEEDGCGTYTIADVTGDPPYGVLSEILDLNGVNSETEAQYFVIEHVHTRVPSAGVSDYWQIGIAWQVGEFENPDNPDYPIPQILGIICMTNINAESEGVYDSDNDIWTVTFEDEMAGLFENVGVDEDGQPIFSYLWEGRLSFTVNITRTNVVT